MEDNPPSSLDELRQKITSNEIKLYHDMPQLLSIINKLKIESDESIEQFKDIIIMLTNELSRVTSDPILAMYKDTIIHNIETRPKNLIDEFIRKTYKINNDCLRDKLIEADEDFFLTNNLEDATEGEENNLNYLFQFKSFWNKLTEENKNILKGTFVALVYMADIRYVNFKKYILLKQLNEHFSEIFNKYDNIF